MNHPKLPAERQVEEWVREYLVAQERSVDAQSILARVRRRLRVSRHSRAEATATVKRGSSPGRRWVWGLASAAAVFLALVLAVEFGTAPVSAETLVNAARVRAEEAVDRCYEVRAERDPELAEHEPVLPAQREGLLWTRGQQFFMKPVRPHMDWAWGRDEKGRVWIAAARQAGFRFAPEEVPPALLMACNLRGMEVETLLKELVAHFDLSREGPVSGEAGPVLIVRGLLKPQHNHKSLRAARLEIDARSKVLRRVVLYHTRATLMFTLVRTAPPDDARYRMETYLDAGAQVNSKEEPLPHRLELLRRQLLRGAKGKSETKTPVPG
jgi:hypothetical protein